MKNATLVAKPNLGYYFVGWFSGETLLSKNLVYYQNATINDVTLTAKFALATEINKCKVKVSDVVYTGDKQEPPVRVSFDGETFVNGEDYTVKYSDNVNVGSAFAVVTGKNRLSGVYTVSFKIKKQTPALKVSDTYIVCEVGDDIILDVECSVPITYSTTNKNVAKVDSDGIITGIGGGKCKIIITSKATDNYNAATKVVTVEVSGKKKENKPNSGSSSKPTTTPTSTASAQPTAAPTSTASAQPTVVPTSVPVSNTTSKARLADTGKTVKVTKTGDTTDFGFSGILFGFGSALLLAAIFALRMLEVKEEASDR